MIRYLAAVTAARGGASTFRLLPTMLLVLSACLLALPGGVAAEVPSAVEAIQGPVGIEAETAARISDKLAQLRTHITRMSAAIDRWPDEAAAWGLQLHGLALEMGVLNFFLMLAAPFLLALTAEALGHHLVRRIHLPAATAEGERWMGALFWFLRRLGGLVLFTLVGLLAFVLLAPPPPLEGIVAAYFTAVVLLRLAKLVLETLLAPATRQQGNTMRIIPMSDEAATFWTRRLFLLVEWYALGYATVVGLAASMSAEARRLDAYVLAIGLVVIATEAIVRRPLDESVSSARRRLGSVLGVLTVIALWCMWVANMATLFHTLLIVAALPLAISLTNAAVANIARHFSPDQTAPLGVTAVFIDRGIRSLLIIAAILGIAHAWGIALGDLSDSDYTLTRIARSGMNAIVIYLIADLIWQISRTAIDTRINGQILAPDDDEGRRRQQRLRTLLPILRNLLFIVVVVVAILMELSAFGIDIAPLIAGAGVVGVAVGFGAQTVVKDIISGMFYLLDDAFRVGEYIQSGSYKGVVESFSLRSVRLRHHRGPVYTVPFGTLGAIQNMSRDWVVVKMTMRLTYDSDLEKARKLVKRIGAEMMEDPEFGPSFLEPLKMQGVEEFDEYGINIRVKMMARPGQQFTIRRKALANIKKAFDENGIRFAVPQVRIAGDAEDAQKAAAAQSAFVHRQTTEANKPIG